MNQYQINNLPFISTEIERLKEKEVLSSVEEETLNEYIEITIRLKNTIAIKRIIDYLYHNNDHLLRKEKINYRHAYNGYDRCYCFYFKAHKNEELRLPIIDGEVSDIFKLASIFKKRTYSRGIDIGHYKTDKIIKVSISHNKFLDDLDFMNLIIDYFQSDIWEYNIFIDGIYERSITMPNNFILFNDKMKVDGYKLIEMIDDDLFYEKID